MMKKTKFFVEIHYRNYRRGIAQLGGDCIHNTVIFLLLH